MTVRTDGGRETKEYLRGGNTLTVRGAARLATRQLALGRHIILLEPTNRFENLFSFNVRLERQGQFCVETLGPGYDSSDLNRGGIPPEYVISGEFRSWFEFPELRWWDLHVARSPIGDEERREARLENIGRHILPALGYEISGSAARWAESWLHSEGDTMLWIERRPLDWGVLKRLLEDAFTVTHWHAVNMPDWTVLVLSGARLADRRTVYWDVVDAGRKWSIPGRAAPPL